MGTPSDGRGPADARSNALPQTGSARPRARGMSGSGILQGSNFPTLSPLARSQTAMDGEFRSGAFPEQHPRRTPSLTHSRQASFNHEPTFVRNRSNTSIYRPNHPLSPNGFAFDHTNDNVSHQPRVLYQQPTGSPSTAAQSLPVINKRDDSLRRNHSMTRIEPGTDLQPPPHRAEVGAKSQPSSRERIEFPPRSTSTAKVQVSTPDPISVRDFALDQLFESFKRQATLKIQSFAADSVRKEEPDLDLLLGSGRDTDFDLMLSAIGQFARKNPRTLVDRLFAWRDNLEYRDDGPKHVHSGSEGSVIDVQIPPGQLNSNSKAAWMVSPQVVSVERQNCAADYVLGRALIEIMSQANLESLSIEKLRIVSDKILNKMVLVETHGSLSRSPMRDAKWKMAVRLLGCISVLDFESISRRYIRELQALQKELAVKGNINRDVESKAEDMLRATRQLRLPLTQLAWRQSADFLVHIAEFFESVHGQRPKLAYARLIEKLLLHAAAHPTGIFKEPQWRKAVRRLDDRLSTLVQKPKYWQAAYSVQAVVACASPSDMFNVRWQQTLASIPSKLRERNHRAVALKALCRLAWTYFETTGDIQPVQLKTIDDISKAVFFSGRKYSLSTEQAVAEPLIQLVRIIGYRQPDVCIRAIIFPLINVDILMSQRDNKFKIDALEPDRIVIGIRAFIAIMADLERQEKPAFPVEFADERDQMYGFPSSPLGSPTFKQRQQLRKPSTIREERLSEPVAAASFSDGLRASFSKFCDVLGRIIRLCDEAFGPATLAEDKVATTNPKTPLAETLNFAKRDESIAAFEERESYYALLHVCIQAIPRFAPYMPLGVILNLLCTGTTHTVPYIAASAVESLKAIARQGNAELVMDRFSTFIFRYDLQHSLSESFHPMDNLHDGTLRLYLELLRMWVDEVQTQVREPTDTEGEQPQTAQRKRQFNELNIWSQVDRIEAQGLFFLCSPSPDVRSFALDVLELIPKFDIAFDKVNTRVAYFLRDHAARVFDAEASLLNVWEDSQVRRAVTQDKAGTLLFSTCRSNDSRDIAFWYKIFTGLIRSIFEACPMGVTLAKDTITSRLVQLHPLIEKSSERGRAFSGSGQEISHERVVPTLSSAAIAQWRLYLIFACVTLTRTGETISHKSPESSHVRRGSRSTISQPEAFATAGDLFSRVVPLLYADSANIREAAVAGLGSINKNLYKPLLQALDFVVRSRSDDGSRSANTHQRAASTPRRHNANELYKTEVVRVYELTSKYLQEPEIYSDPWILQHVAAFTHHLSVFLHTPQNQMDRLKLQQSYCGLLEGLFIGISRSEDPLQWMPFPTRVSAFVLLEKLFEMPSGLESETFNNKSGKVESQVNRQNTALAQEIPRLRIAACNAMATLCAGPMAQRVGNETHHFQVSRILEWIDGLFQSDIDRFQAIGRRALRNVITFNKQYVRLCLSAIDKLYEQKKPGSLKSYLSVLMDVFKTDSVPDIPFWKILSALLFTLGNTDSNIRMMSAGLLRSFEEREGTGSKLQDFYISIADKTRVVNKTAQFGMSDRLVKHHPDLAPFTISEMSRHFIKLSPDLQRSMVNILIPWLRTIELQFTVDGNLTGASYVILINLVYITVKCQAHLDYEIQALWQSLATEEHPGNVRLILDFVTNLSLRFGDPNFFPSAKQIVVHLASSRAGGGVIDALLQNINPSRMNPEQPCDMEPPPDAAAFSFVAQLSEISGAQQNSMSTGQISLILLVDLVVTEVVIATERVPSLLQIVLVLWDHHLEVVREQAREMLVHLIHELVLSKMTFDETGSDISSIETFIESIRRNDRAIVWTYEDNNTQYASYEVPSAMMHVVRETARIFALKYTGIELLWGSVVWQWSTHCSVRHLACRSLQIYRCLLRPFDHILAADLLSQIASRLSDEKVDVQVYCMEMLHVVRAVAATNKPEHHALIPQLFWITCACLNSSNEWEYLEGLSILSIIMSKASLEDENTLEKFLDAKPAEWPWNQLGLTGLILRGCRSVTSSEEALSSLDSLTHLSSNELVGYGPRFLLALLANLPRFIQSFEEKQIRPSCSMAARSLADAARQQHQNELSFVLTEFSQRRLRTSGELLTRVILYAKTAVLGFESEILKFLMGLLFHRVTWVKAHTLRILLALVPEIDTRTLSSSDSGTDLVSPLFKLVHSELFPQAIQVLDSLFASLSFPQDKKTAQPISNSIALYSRNVYSRTSATFYGNAEASGWVHPGDINHQTNLRLALSSLRDKYIERGGFGGTALSSPEVEFWQDPSTEHSYFSGRTIVSDDMTLTETTMGELVTKLDSLDDFFDSDHESSSTQSYAHSVRSVPGTPNSLKARVNGYDSAEPRMRSPHMRPNLSINSSFTMRSADNVPSLSKEHTSMSPSAFHSPISPKSLVRPRLGSRSITVPTASQHSTGDAYGMQQQYEAEIGSEDEIGIGQPGPESADHSGLPRRRPSLGSRIKRIATGDRHHRAVTRAQLDMDSPEVPKLPEKYQNPPQDP